MNEHVSVPSHTRLAGAASSLSFTTTAPYQAKRSCASLKAAGYTLIETMVTLSLLSTLAFASVAILNSLTKDSIESAHDRQSRRDIHRIANSLREDSTRTSSLKAGKLAWPVTLPHEKSQTVYDWNESENSLIRTETAGNSTLRLERFLLPKGSMPEMTAESSRLTFRVNLPGPDNSWIIEGNLKDGAVKP